MRLMKDKLTGLLGMAQAREQRQSGDDEVDSDSRTQSSSDESPEYVSTTLITGAASNVSEIQTESLALSELTSRLKTFEEKHL